jgi:hypothetical protein
MDRLHWHEFKKEAEERNAFADEWQQKPIAIDPQLRKEVENLLSLPVAKEPMPPTLPALQQRRPSLFDILRHKNK